MRAGLDSVASQLRRIYGLLGYMVGILIAVSVLYFGVKQTIAGDEVSLRKLTGGGSLVGASQDHRSLRFHFRRPQIVIRAETIYCPIPPYGLPPMPASPSS